MAKSKGKPLRGQALRETNKQISKLRELGLYRGKAARGQPTAYAKKLVTKFESALNRTASVVSIPRAEKKGLMERLGGLIQFKGSKAIIEKAPQNEEIARFNKKTKQIDIFGIGEGNTRYTRTLTPEGKEAAPVKKGNQREWRYNFPAQRKKNGKMGRSGKSPWFDTLSELVKFGDYAKRHTGLKQFIEYRDIRKAA